MIDNAQELIFHSLSHASFFARRVPPNLFKIPMEIMSKVNPALNTIASAANLCLAYMGYKQAKKDDPTDLYTFLRIAPRVFEGAAILWPTDNQNSLTFSYQLMLASCLADVTLDFYQYFFEITRPIDLESIIASSAIIHAANISVLTLVLSYAEKNAALSMGVMVSLMLAQYVFAYVTMFHLLFDPPAAAKTSFETDQERFDAKETVRGILSS